MFKFYFSMYFIIIGVSSRSVPTQMAIVAAAVATTAIAISTLSTKVATVVAAIAVVVLIIMGTRWWGGSGCVINAKTLGFLFFSLEIVKIPLI